MGYLRGVASNMDMLDVFSSVKWYLYHRPDSMGAGYVYNWKTNSDNKLKILNQMRDNYTLRMLSVRSIPLLEEMERIVQDGGEIQAEGRAKDDRAFATALAVTAWIDWVRGGLIAEGQTHERVCQDERNAKDSPQASLVGRVVIDFFKANESARLDAEEARAWGIVDGR